MDEELPNTTFPFPLVRAPGDCCRYRPSADRRNCRPDVGDGSTANQALLRAPSAAVDLRDVVDARQNDGSSDHHSHDAIVDDDRDAGGNDDDAAADDDNNTTCPVADVFCADCRHHRRRRVECVPACE
jgi:hypothetical protein